MGCCGEEDQQIFSGGRLHLCIWTIFYTSKVGEGAQKSAGGCQKVHRGTGLTINEEKSVLVPTQRISYLGKVWDTVEGVVLDEEERVRGSKKTISEMLGNGRASINELEKLVGKLEWHARTMPYSRCWKRSLLMELRAWKQWTRDSTTGLGVGPGLGVRGSGFTWNGRPWTLSPASRRELKWWRDNLGAWRLRTELGELARGGMKEIFVDASGYAYGATNAVWGLWNEEEFNWNIAVKEIEALRRAVTKLPSNSSWTVWTDNKAVFWSMKRGRAFCWELNDAVRTDRGDMNARGLRLDVRWVRSEDNPADWISRERTRHQTWSEEDGLLCSQRGSGWTGTTSKKQPNAF